MATTKARAMFTPDHIYVVQSLKGPFYRIYGVRLTQELGGHSCIDERTSICIYSPRVAVPRAEAKALSESDSRCQVSRAGVAGTGKGSLRFHAIMRGVISTGRRLGVAFHVVKTSRAIGCRGRRACAIPPRDG